MNDFLYIIMYLLGVLLGLSIPSNFPSVVFTIAINILQAAIAIFFLIYITA